MKLFQGAITIPVASETRERSFTNSELLALTSMQQKRFTNLFSKCIERESVNEIDTERILNTFVLTTKNEIVIN